MSSSSGTTINYTQEQISCVCETLLQSNDTNRLTRFLYSISNNPQISSNETVLRSRALIAFQRGNFKELYQILQSYNFDSAHHQKLQLLW